MLGYVISIAIGVAIGSLWLFLWALVLRVSGIPVFGKKSPEQREMRRQRLLRMGHVRYVVVEEILGFGVALGLGMTVSEFIRHEAHGWIYAVCKAIVFAVLFGLVSSIDGWARVRGAVPFPPESLGEK